MPPFFGKSNPTPPRTDAERERERLERERRRGGADAPPLPPSIEGAGDDPLEPSPAVAVPPPPAAREPEPPVEPEPRVEPEPEPAAELHDDLDEDLPAARARPTLAPPPGRRGRAAPAPTAVRTGGRRITAGRVLALVVLVLIVGAVWFGIELFEPFTGSGHGRVVVVVPTGDGATQVGDLLASRGVVSSGFFFNLYAAIEGDRGELNSGTFVLRKGMSYSSAIAALSATPAPPPTVSVLVPEGDSRPEIADLARHDGLTGDYLTASVHSPLLSPQRYGAPRSTPNLEGFLFPATYSLDRGASVHGLVGDQLAAFMQNVNAPYERAARRMHITLYQLLIVASMIEREAFLPADRAKVAAVIYNRLRLAMPLGIDATIRFALNDWTSPLTEAQLQTNSPYNTRLHIGLPPTPIGNPGLASLTAAAHPAHVPYLYYVAGADGCGELKFSTSSQAFDQDVAAYQAALSANHGRVPTCHKR